MTDTTTDAQLVTAHLAGDRSAFAAIYDRYGGALFDTAAAMTRDRDDAADITQDVLVIAAERLGQLRDPDRLKPWLFAILRNEVYRRTRRRRRTVPTDFTEPAAEVALPTEPADEGSAAELAELAELVRGAAAGLDERDQLVLELSVRQGLAGEDLAAALGVTPQQGHNLVHRMRRRTERSLGAFCVARRGRGECEELARILQGWDGEFSVLIRKRVARHIDRCDVCERSRRTLAPLALFGAAPAFAAPPELRDRVLGAVGRGAAPAYAFSAPGGFPVLATARRVGLWIVPATLALLAVGGTAAYVLGTDDGSLAIVESGVTTTAAGRDSGTGAPAPATTDGATSGAGPTSSAAATVGAAPSTAGAAPSTSTTAGGAGGAATSSTSASAVPTASTSTIVVVLAPNVGTATTATTTTVITATAPPVPAPTPGTPPATVGTTTTAAPATPTTTPPTTAATTTSSTTSPAAGDLALSAGSLDFGTTLDRARVTLTNTGGQHVDWVVASGPATLRGAVTPFSVVPASGTLGPGAAVDVTVSFDRSWPVEGPAPTRRFTFSAPGTSTAIDVDGVVVRPPTVRASSPPSTQCARTRTGAVNPLIATATVLDESKVVRVAFTAVDPQGRSATILLDPGRVATTWTGALDPDLDGDGDPETGLWTWRIEATDQFGGVGTDIGSTDILPTFC